MKRKTTTRRTQGGVQNWGAPQDNWGGAQNNWGGAWVGNDNNVGWDNAPADANAAGWGNPANEGAWGNTGLGNEGNEDIIPEVQSEESDHAGSDDNCDRHLEVWTRKKARPERYAAKFLTLAKDLQRLKLTVPRDEGTACTNKIFLPVLLT